MLISDSVSASFTDVTLVSDKGEEDDKGGKDQEYQEGDDEDESCLEIKGIY